MLPAGALPRRRRPPDPELTNDGFCTTAHAARLLHVSRDTLYRWCEAGTLKAHKLGGRWRIELASVHALKLEGSP